MSVVHIRTVWKSFVKRLNVLSNQSPYRKLEKNMWVLFFHYFHMCENRTSFILLLLCEDSILLRPSIYAHDLGSVVWAQLSYLINYCCKLLECYASNKWKNRNRIVNIRCFSFFSNLLKPKLWKVRTHSRNTFPRYKIKLRRHSKTLIMRRRVKK